jgi:hypothetical protein
MRVEIRCWAASASAAAMVVVVGSSDVVWSRFVVTVLKSGILLQATREDSCGSCEYRCRDGVSGVFYLRRSGTMLLLVDLSAMLFALFCRVRGHFPFRPF